MCVLRSCRVTSDLHCIECNLTRQQWCPGNLLIILLRYQLVTSITPSKNNIFIFQQGKSFPPHFVMAIKEHRYWEDSDCPQLQCAQIEDQLRSEGLWESHHHPFCGSRFCNQTRCHSIFSISKHLGFIHDTATYTVCRRLITLSYI